MAKRLIVIATVIVAVLGFGAGAIFYDRNSAVKPEDVTTTGGDDLVRPYSPTIGRADAKVTIVEFLDPACEACRAFYPIVKQLLSQYPNELRLVIRYTPFHDGSEDAIRILETARLQGMFEPVLEAVFAAQPRWAAHGYPNIDRAWEAARSVGLDITKARREASMPLIDAILKQDISDVQTRGINQTPTFFVNGKPLLSFGRQQLQDLVREEIEASRKSPGRS